MSSQKNDRNKIYDFLTNLKVVKYSTIIAFMTFVICTTLGYIIAQFDPAGPGADPAGYNIMDSYLSDMGSIRYTPWPYFPVIGNIISAILLIPTIVYMGKILTEIQNESEESSYVQKILGFIGAFWMFIGLIGRFGLGVFSEDVSRMFPLPLHWYFTVLEFAGLTFGGIFFGLIIVSYKTLLPKPLGGYMIFVPTILAVMAFSQGLQPIEEWILTFSIIGYLFVGGIIVLRYINIELASK